MAEERFAKRASKQRDAAIVHSLLSSFNEHGCFETTLDQVATEVGIGKGTLYRHYSSREDLFGAALQAGIDALMARCRDTWEMHAPDFDAAFRALISDFVALNHRGDALSPATLERLSCSCRWLNPSHPEDGKLELALVPLAQRWQAAGLLERTADPSWIAAVTLALVNSPGIRRRNVQELVEPSAAGTAPRRPVHAADIADRIVEALRRSFAPIPESASAGVGL